MCAPQSDFPADSILLENHEPPQGTRVIDKRAITSDDDRHERLVQLVAGHLTQAELGGTIGEKVALSTDTLPRFAEGVVPGQIR